MFWMCFGDCIRYKSFLDLIVRRQLQYRLCVVVKDNWFYVCSFFQFSLIKFDLRYQLLLYYLHACATSLEKNVSIRSNKHKILNPNYRLQQNISRIASQSFRRWVLGRLLEAIFPFCRLEAVLDRAAESSHPPHVAHAPVKKKC